MSEKNQVTREQSKEYTYFKFTRSVESQSTTVFAYWAVVYFLYPKIMEVHLVIPTVAQIKLKTDLHLSDFLPLIRTCRRNVKGLTLEKEL